MHNNFVISTDSTCDWLPPVRTELGLNNCVSLGFTFKTAVQFDPTDVDEFYRNLAADPNVTTSAANPHDFIAAWEPVLQAGTDILYFGLAESLSSTYESSYAARATLLEAYPDRHIVCLSSRCVAPGLGLLAKLAEKQRQAGATMGEVVKFVESTKARVAHYFTLNDLEQLKRGGRIGTVAQVFADTLKIRPLMAFNHEDKLVVTGKIRGDRKTMAALVAQIADNFDHDFPDNEIVIAYGADQERALYAAELIKEHPALQGINVVFSRIGPVIGAHVGSSVVAFFFIGHHR